MTVTAAPPLPLGGQPPGQPGSAVLVLSELRRAPLIGGGLGAHGSGGVDVVVLGVGGGGEGR